ncbi:MAG: hypothetical protein QF752_12110 [Planctomycetota bacterium]|nr:hypothetical protein [Planctomycetota bacterium]
MMRQPVGKSPGSGPVDLAYRHWTDLRQHTFSRSGRDFDASMSHDRSSLAFASTRDSQRPDIFFKQVDGRTAIRRTVHPADDRFPAVSPNGKLIAFASNRNGSWDIFLCASNGGAGVIQITHGPDDDMAPSWSPDGKEIAYCARDIAGQWWIWIYHHEKGTLTNLGPGMFPSFSPDGEWIAFQKATPVGNRGFSIWRVRTDGSEATQVMNHHEWAGVHPAWSEDGKWIVFARAQGATVSGLLDPLWRADDIWMVGSDGRDLTSLTIHEAADWSPTWGADGRIYFTSSRSGSWNIWSLKPRDLRSLHP